MVSHMIEEAARIYKDKIEPQRLGHLKERMTSGRKFVDFFNARYCTDWYCMNCKSADETVMDGMNIVTCLECKIEDKVYSDEI